jgi:hypothetical protein
MAPLSMWPGMFQLKISTTAIMRMEAKSARAAINDLIIALCRAIHLH